MRPAYIVGDPVRGRDFYGRQEELAELLTGRGKTAHVLGLRRVGKTSLLCKVAESGPSVYLDFQAMVGQPEDFTRQVGFELRRRRKLYPWLPAPNQGNDGFVWLEEAAWQAEKQEVTLCLLCDEAEGLLDFEAPFLRRLRGLVWGPTQLRTMFASAKNLSKLDDLCRE
jgi:AAA+ ATPase superfamily predicted ATPase